MTQNELFSLRLGQTIYPFLKYKNPLVILDIPRIEKCISKNAKDMVFVVADIHGCKHEENGDYLMNHFCCDNDNHIKEKITVYEGYLLGKTIQAKGKKSYTKNVWHDVNKPIFEYNDFDYRIKPEPKLRPYKSAEEFLQAQKEHGMMIKSCGQYFFATMVDRDRGIVINNIKCSIFITYQELLESRLWQDGTPCGIEE